MKFRTLALTLAATLTMAAPLWAAPLRVVATTEDLDNFFITYEIILGQH